MRAVCRHTDECSGWLEGRSSPPRLWPPLPSPPPPVLPQSPCSLDIPVHRVAAPLSSSGRLLPADARPPALSSAPLSSCSSLSSSPAFLLFFPPWDQGRTQHTSVSHGRCGHEGRPGSLPGLLWPGSPPSPNSLHSGASVSDWKPRPGLVRTAARGPSPEGREGPPPRVQLAPRHSSQSSPVEPQPAQRWRSVLKPHPRVRASLRPQAAGALQLLGWESRAASSYVHTHTHTHLLNFRAKGDYSMYTF